MTEKPANNNFIISKDLTNEINKHNTPIHREKWLNSINAPMSELLFLEPLLSEIEESIYKNISVKVCHRVFRISNNVNSEVFLDGLSMKLSGNSISSHLSQCHSLTLFAITLGSTIEKEINKLQLNNITSSFLMDNGASILIDQLCYEYTQTLSKYVTYPFSPGYGDFSINYQSKIMTVLECQKTIGLTLTDKNIMLPRKSITAVVGISSTPITSNNLSCENCKIINKCNFYKHDKKCYEQIQ